MRASCPSRPARVALAGLAVVISLLASGGAHADDPASQADALRANSTGLAAKSHQVLLRLYSLQSRLAQSAQRLEALEKQSARLEQAQASARSQLTIARESMTAAHSHLGRRLRQLYIEGDVDPLAVLLGAESLDDALAAFDGLNRLAEQDQQIIEELAKARAALRTAITRLAARRAELRATLDQAEAAHASLARTQAQQNAYLASLRRQQELNRSQISKLSTQAAASEQRSEDISSAAPKGQQGYRLVDRLLPARWYGHGDPGGLGRDRSRPVLHPAGDAHVRPGLRRGSRRGHRLRREGRRHRPLVPDMRPGTPMGLAHGDDHAPLDFSKDRHPRWSF